jgi:hypothetical protein
MLEKRTQMPAASPPSARGKHLTRAPIRGKASARAGKVRLLTLDHLDYRTCASRRARKLADGFEAELGGSVTPTMRLAIERAAALVALSEDAKARRLAGDSAVSLEDIVRTDNAAARAVKALGTPGSAVPSPLTPAEYLARRAAERAGKPSGNPA